MQNNIPEPNPFITEWLVGPECRRLMNLAGFQAQTLYRAVEVKRTGEMAASAVVEVRLGGLRRDRLIAALTVKDPASASHIFGAGDHPASTGRHHNQPTPTLQTVLRLMAGGAA